METLRLRMESAADGGYIRPATQTFGDFTWNNSDNCFNVDSSVAGNPETCRVLGTATRCSTGDLITLYDADSNAIALKMCYRYVDNSDSLEYVSYVSAFSQEIAEGGTLLSVASYTMDDVDGISWV
ncbi:hypothetical protein KIPB_010944 [Kipferlia bialata]|uniref:Uncharacterized protein n=1 Tax=Kipferlia bialata TaxID=797122 RepID=A0A9K3GMQ4_9EUKA|nr:hypothetical protein KIPB_010944 [Kipferlia bialata]|eukprot:g10944.t1